MTSNYRDRPLGRTKRKRPSSPKYQLSSRWRLFLVWLILMGGISSLMANLFRLQVTQSSALRAKAISQQRTSGRSFVPRRPIVDRNNVILAIDQPAYTLYAHPKLFKQKLETIAHAVAPIVKQPAAKLFAKLGTAPSGIMLEYALTEDLANRIRSLQIDGLELVSHQQRLYPQGHLFAEVVGYVDVDRQGRAGVEAAHQNLLERSVKPIWLNRAGDGSILPDRLPAGFLDTDELQLALTLDSRLQRIARSALKRQMEKYKAKRGTVIVMDASNGALLSLVVEPNYDSNLYYKSPIELLKNWALSDLYEPGSTFKPVNVAIALEERAIAANSAFYDEGQLHIDNWPIQNHDFRQGVSRKKLTVTQILQYSSNVGMVHIMEKLPSAVYYNWLKRLGLGENIGIDLPGEMSGQIKTKAQFTGSPVEPATTAFGQGFSLTPLQLAQIQAILANGGYLVTPHVVRGLFDSQGQPHWKNQLPPPKQVFSFQTTQAVLEMMEQVVSQGTGKAAQIPNYLIAGKTGTAQKAHPQGGYYERARITSFVGILPVNLPPDPDDSDRGLRPVRRYVVLAVIDEPIGDDAYGGTVAAPIVKSVMESLITIAQIPPQ
ncbi:MAG: peptidoglycan D,D-transpeptidase FtsI family protein [Hormoscilla sp.]